MMTKKLEKKPKNLWMFIAIVFAFGFWQEAKAQCDPVNIFGYSQDQMQAAYHAVIYKTSSGYSITGSRGKPDGVNNQLTITDVTPANGYNYSGTLVKATLGSFNSGNNQTIALSSTGVIYAWGKAGVVLSTSVKSTSDFGPIGHGLPVGVAASDVKEFIAVPKALALLTNSGQLYITGFDNFLFNFGGTTTSGWNHINSVFPASDNIIEDIDIAGTFDNFIATNPYRGNVAFARTSKNNLYTWGNRYAFLGNGTSPQTLNTPTLMTNPLPAGVNFVQVEVSLTGYAYNVQLGLSAPFEYPGASYYVLGSNGNVYTMGEGTTGQLGRGGSYNNSGAHTQNDDPSWALAHISTNPATVGKVRFLSATDNDGYATAVNVILDDKTIRAWGNNKTYNQIGGNPSVDFYYTPITPANSGTVLVAEAGGHIVPYLSTTGQICNIGHNLEGGFGDGTTTDRTTYVCYDKPSTFQASPCAEKPDLTANNDGPFNVIYGNGFVTTDIRANDDLNGAAPTSANTSISQSGTWPTGFTLNSNGTVSVANNIAAGSYILAYQICSTVDASVCSIAYITINILKDTDGDGLTDNTDLDDDNDGILDTAENSACSASTPVTYGNNLAVNSSFESGNTGFTSSFSYGTCNNVCGDGWEVTSGNYYIVQNACNCSGSNAGVSAWQAVPHSGNNLMLVDFPLSGTSDLYKQTISVKPNTRYNFSAWLINLIPAGNDAPDPSLQLAVQENSGTIQNIGTGVSVAEGAGWQQTAFDYTTSASATTLTVIIRNGNSGGSGNDAGIDDIVLREVYCDTDGDGVPNQLDLDSDGDGCPDALEGGDNIAISMLDSNNRINVAANGTTTPLVVDVQGVPVVVNSGSAFNVDGQAQGQTAGTAYNNGIGYNACKCFKAGATGGTVLSTNHGVTVLGRAGDDGDGNTANDWPMVRKGAWTALEGKSKGFVINRVPTTAQVNAITNAVEGMMVYDEEADCLKIYTKDDAPATTYSWRCFNNQTCPDVL